MNDYVLTTLGSILERDHERDAVHIAIIPVIAGEALAAGQHVMVREGQAYRRVGHHAAVGVVDPYLPRELAEGERFWLFMWPQSITSLRHQWGHPAFPMAGPRSTPEQVAQSEQWLHRFANEHKIDYEDLVKGAADGSGARFGEDHYGAIGSEDGIDAVEFWRHVETVTGCQFSQAHRLGTYFGCSC